MMKHLCYVICMLLAAASAQHKLELQKALPLDGPEFIQPAGLAFSGATLVLASAGHDDVLFQVDLAADKAAYKPFLKLKLPKDAGDRKLAYRGLAAEPGGGFHLLSGSACRILKVTPRGAMDWEGPGLLEAGVEKGLFAGENSGAEGLARLGAGDFLVAASREPRGLIEVGLAGPKPAIDPYVMGKTKIALQRGRKPDFSGLAEDGGKIWALVAGAEAVCQIVKHGKEFSEGDCFSFSHVSNDAKYKYAGLRMGLARALAVDAQSLYIALDNKGVGRQSDPADKRPLLLVFKKPR